MAVVFMGANGSVQLSDLEQARRIMGPRRVLVVLTPREKGGGAGSDAAAVRRFAARHPRQVRLLDWVAHTEGRSGWFYEDGLHPSHPGAGELARYIARAKRWYPAAPPCSVQTAARLLRTTAGVTAGAPLCADFTADRITDMVVLLESGEPRAVRGWSLFVQRGVEWKLASANGSTVLEPYAAQPPYMLTRVGLRRLVVTATLAPECPTCPARTQRFDLGWERPRFVVRTAHAPQPS